MGTNATQFEHIVNKHIEAKMHEPNEIENKNQGKIGIRKTKAQCH